MHTEFSIKDGMLNPKKVVHKAIASGMKALAITDATAMFGDVIFYKAASAAGIKPILGADCSITNHYNRDDYLRLLFLARNHQGYLTLCDLLSRAWLTNQYKDRGEVDLDWITPEMADGLIVLSGFNTGAIGKAILNGSSSAAEQEARRLSQKFPHFFMELQRVGRPNDEMLVAESVKLAKKLGLPVVATQPIQFENPEDFEFHEARVAIADGFTLANKARPRIYTPQQYFRTKEEMCELFKDIPSAIENSVEIAKRCNVTIKLGKPQLPIFPTPDGMSLKDYMAQLAREGLDRRLKVLYPDEKKREAEFPRYKERLEREIKIIQDMDFPGYFLIVQDFINWAKTHGCPVGPGRGSGAGSLVAYSLGITDLDPLAYDLLFERFLNPERVSMPDIDVDFCFERRQEVIDYVGRKYGNDKVVQIVTFGTLAAKGVIRDVGRVMDLPYAFVDSIAKMVPNELNITLNKALEMNPEFRKLYQEDEQVHHLIDMCKRLEGLPRHTSMHAAGVVICQKSADEFVPLSRGSDGSIVTQFTMTTLEELGLLKMDFLGLRTLTVIHDAVKFIENTTGRHIDVDAIDYNDPKVLASIGTGRTEGVFQLESAGMKSFMKELRPQNLEDVVAGISLYRPGPMDFIPKYIQGKNHPDAVTYACPQLEPILKPTYGCIVYQEQVMQIVRDLAGYTLGRSDLVRRAMSKKKQSVMEKERANFIYGNPEENVPGCIANGIDEQTAGQIYDMMMDFAKYAFNKSHAACYAVVAYQTAYLKYYYPVEFMAALMTSVIDNPKKVSEYILNCRNMNIAILPPDVNAGEAGFSVTDGKIRYALTAIKGVGRPIIDSLVQERKERGPFTNLKDFITRMSDKKEMNKRAIENLIKAGAMDGLGGTRKQFMSVYVQIADHIAHDKKNNLAGQISLFDIAGEEDKEEFDIRMPDVGEYNKEMLLGFEKEVLGVYVSGHPLEEYQELWQNCISNTAGDFALDEETGEVQLVRDQANAVIGGLIADKTVKYTKNDKIMAFLNVEDLIGNVEVVVFPQVYERYSTLLVEDAKVFIRGRVSLEEDKDGKLICDQIISFEDAQAARAANQPLFPRNYGGRGGSSRGGSYGNGSGNGGAGGYRNAGNGYGQYQNDGMNSSSMSVGQTGQAAGQMQSGQRTQANGTPQKKGMPAGAWIQFPNMEAYKTREQELLQAIADSDGDDDVVIYLRDIKNIKILPQNLQVKADGALMEKLTLLFGKENVKFITKPIENRSKID